MLSGRIVLLGPIKNLIVALTVHTTDTNIFDIFEPKYAIKLNVLAVKKNCENLKILHFYWLSRVLGVNFDV